MKKIITLLLALSTLLLFSACGKKTESDTDYIQKKGTLVVGVTSYEPMDYQDASGQWTGFDAEFAQAVAKELGVEAQFIEIDWDNKFFELDSKAIDCIWNGMTITEEVKRNTSVSDPYVKNAQVVVMPKDTAGGYDAVELLQGLNFAVEAGSAGEAAVKDLTGVTCTSVQSQASALMETAAGTADACVIDITMANAMTGQGTSYADLAPGLSLTSEEYGVGFRKDSDLTQKFNDFRKTVISDGTLQALAEKYNLTLAG